MSSIRLSARLGAAVAALAAPFVLVACGAAAQPDTTAAPAGAQASADRNAADVRFAQVMIPHHQEALDLAAIATDRATSAEVRELAAQIRSAQDPEIATLTGLLETWGAEVPAGPMAGMDGMGGTDHSAMPGMTTAEQREQLRAATGPAFDTMFLEMMIAHHESAVADAQREVTEGANPDAQALAARIVEAQSAEITQMRQLLQTS